MSSRRREFMLEMARLDPATRRRVYRFVRRGEAAANGQEARLVAAVARRALRGLPWLIGAALALALLVGVSAWFHVRREEWFLVVLDTLILVLSAANIALQTLWRAPRYRRAERLNVAVAEEAEVDQEQG
jgi:hypothetical protein